MATQGKCLLMPGSIDAEELTQIIVTLYEVEGRSRVHRSESTKT